MAALWPLSLNTQLDKNGDPLVGAQVFFWNTGTEVPQLTYADYGLGTVSSHDGDGAVVTDANGRWPAIFLSPTPGTYRMRALDADGAVLFDVDGVPVTQNADASPPDAGDTDTKLLAHTGDLKARYSTGTDPGWVRGAGKTIGSAESGATERANDDCEDLFIHLWTVDANLAVSGGRGANAASDWNADKTIALPDLRGRTLVGLADMGNSASTLLDDVDIDGSGTVTTLGATLGDDAIVLDVTQMPTHAHDATFVGDEMDPHSHDIGTGIDGGGSVKAGNQKLNSPSTEPATAGTPTGTVTLDDTGGGLAHPNVQPSMLVTIYIKL